MEATQIREGLRRSIIHLVAVAIAAVIGLTASRAQADCPSSDVDSTTVTPANTAFTASSSNVKFVLGNLSVNCSSSSTSGTVPASPDNHNDHGGVCTSISNPTFTGCRTSVGTNATATVGNGWTFNLQWHSAGHVGTLNIPTNGIKFTTSIFGITCTATSGPTSITCPWTNNQLVCTNVTVPVVTSGGFPCPSGTSATFSGTFTASPTITVGP